MDEILEVAEKIFLVEWFHARFRAGEKWWEIEIGGIGYNSDPVTYDFAGGGASPKDAAKNLIEHMKEWVAKQ